MLHFLMTNVLQQQQLLYFITWSRNQLLNLNIFSFLFLRNFLPQASRITTRRILFTEIFFSVSKECVCQILCVRSWSYASVTIYVKTLCKKLKAVRPKSCREGEKEKEKHRQLQSVMR